MRVTVQHFYYEGSYSCDGPHTVDRRDCLDFINDLSLRQWLIDRDVHVYGEAFNVLRGSHFNIYADMDQSQYLLYLLQFDSASTRVITT